MILWLLILWLLILWLLILWLLILWLLILQDHYHFIETLHAPPVSDIYKL
jgi:hypothetical protein